MMLCVDYGWIMMDDMGWLIWGWYGLVDCLIMYVLNQYSYGVNNWQELNLLQYM